MSKLPILFCVPHNASILAPVLEPLVPRLFSQMVMGNSPADFAAVRASTDADIVVLFGGAGSCDVLNDVCKWTGGAADKRRVTWAHSYFTGMDAFDLPSIEKAVEGIPISNARNVFSSMLAEHVMLSQLYFNRQVWRMQELHTTSTYERYPIAPSKNQRLGVLGYGGIGHYVAKAAIQGFNMEVVGWGADTLPADDLGVTCASGPEGLKNVLNTCDFVVNTMPLTPETRHMLTIDHFRQMKKTGVFINIGRGATTVESDLCTALNEGSIAGAALDVFEVEPLPATSPLWGIGNDKLLLSAHNADISATSYQEAVKHFVGEAERFVKHGKLPDYLVDVAKGY